MKNLLQELTNIPLNYVIIACVALFYSLEQLLNTPFKFEKRAGHLVHSVLVQLAVYGVALLFAIVQVSAIDWSTAHSIGLFNQIEIPFPARAIIGVVLLDFTTYWCHRLCHKVGILWRIHRVHHSDTSMDSTTYLRVHPLEVLVFGTAQGIVAVLFGLDTATLGLYLLVLTPFTVAQHANIHFPNWIDMTLGKLFTTPNMHKVHHSQNQHYTDSNFADIFIVWDKLFGTYKYVPVGEIVYGLHEFDEERKQTFWYLLKSPFMTIK